MDDGFRKKLFAIGRCVYQGDPLTPCLLLIEILAIRIRENNCITDIVVGEEEIKLYAFVDDLTFLRDVSSAMLIWLNR